MRDDENQAFVHKQIKKSTLLRLVFALEIVNTCAWFDADLASCYTERVATATSGFKYRGQEGNFPELGPSKFHVECQKTSAPGRLAGGEGAGCPLFKNSPPALGLLGLAPGPKNRRLGSSQHDGLDPPMATVSMRHTV